MLTTDLPARGSGIEVVRTNETLIMGTLVHVITEDASPDEIRAIAVQDITGGLYWIGSDEIHQIRPHRQGRLL